MSKSELLNEGHTFKTGIWNYAGKIKKEKTDEKQSRKIEKEWTGSVDRQQTK